MVIGPPGTGKTTVILEICQQMIKSKKRVLFCSNSNVAVDNLFLKLPKGTKHAARAGNYLKVSDEIQHFRLDVIQEEIDQRINSEQVLFLIFR